MEVGADTSNTANTTGTYKRFAPAEVAWMVKQVRNHFGLKQLALAQDAGVTERTIERIEAGIAVSDDTLKRVAKALKLSEDVFTKANYWPSEEEVTAEVKKIQAERTVTELHDLSDARQLENLLGQHGHLIDGSILDEALADTMASLEDLIQDWGNLFGGVSATEKLTACREVFAIVREVESHGYVARWGRYQSDEKMWVGVLVFFKRETVENPGHMRKAIVPRSLTRDAMW